MRPVLEKIGANVRQLETIVEAELKHLPRSSGGPPGASQHCEGARCGPGRSRRHEGRVRLDRAPAARAGRHEVEGAGICSSTRSPRTRCSARCKQSAGGTRDRSIARRQVPGPGKVRHRPRRAGPAGQARPGDRPRPGNPPRDPGAVAAHEEQPRAHRRAGRRQDGDRRRASPCASSRATCRRASRTGASSRSTWARSSPARSSAASSKSGSRRSSRK